MPGMRAFTRKVFPGRRWSKSADTRTRAKGSLNKSISSGPSIVGTVGSRFSAARVSRKDDDEFELITFEGEDSGAGHEHPTEENRDTK